MHLQPLFPLLRLDPVLHKHKNPKACPPFGFRIVKVRWPRPMLQRLNELTLAQGLAGVAQVQQDHTVCKARKGEGSQRVGKRQPTPTSC
eukprot:1159365-Pelagomonas_calceolata.AAC.5